MSTCSTVTAAVAAARRALLPFARRIPPEIREELCQETVLRVLTATTVRSPQAFAWRVAHHLALDHLRRERGVELPVDLPVPNAFGMDQRMDARTVVRAVSARSAGQGQLLARLYLGDREIEDLLPVGAKRERERSAVYKRRDRALRSARELFPELTRLAA